MKKRKVLSLFAILFVAVFALSVCFFAACKGGEDDADDGVNTEEPEDTGDGEDEGESSEPGSEGGEEKKGTPLTGDEDIIGTWTGEVDIEASALGMGGTLASEMTVEITDSSDFELSFVPTELTVAEGSDVEASTVESFLGLAGIKMNESFRMFTGMTVYYDAEADGYYADINGDWVKCQLPLEINEDGQLCILFTEPLNFSGISVSITFDAKLDKVVLTALPEDECAVRVPTSDDADYLVFDGTNAFENRGDLSIVSYDGLYYTVNGTSSSMTEEIAAWFGGDDYAKVDDQYVVIKIAVAEGETITYGHDSTKSYTNGGADDDDFYNGYHFIVYKLTFDENGVCTSEATYTVTDTDENETEYTVSFSGVTVLRGVVTLAGDEITIAVGSGTYALDASAKMSDGSSYTGGYAWSSSDSSIAGVKQGTVYKYRGNITPVAEGVAYITVTLDDGTSATCKVNVVPAPTVTSVAISPDTVVIKLGESVEISAIVGMSDGSEYDGSYAWESSEESVATVDPVMGGILGRTPTDSAKVTAVAEGTATITLTLDDNQTAECTVIVVDPLVLAYEGNGVTLGDSTANFANGNALNVTVTVDENGAYDYAVTGIATAMTEDQITAYNSFYTNDTATTGDAYIVIEIKAAAGSTVSYNGAQITVGDNATSVAVVQKVSSSDTARKQTVTITSGGVTETFTVTFTGAAVPDTELAGTWSNPSINATATVIVDFDATASVELTVNADGTYELSISNISVPLLSSVDLSSIKVEMKGTWIGGEGTYILTGEEGNEVTVVLTTDEDGAQVVQMSFNITYELESMSIPISVSDAVLSAGALSSTDAD